MPEDYNKKYISLYEASTLCSYSQDYLSLRARQGKLKAIKIGRNWMTTVEWLTEYTAHNNGNGDNSLNKNINPPAGGEAKIKIVSQLPSVNPVRSSRGHSASNGVKSETAVREKWQKLFLTVRLSAVIFYRFLLSSVSLFLNFLKVGANFWKNFFELFLSAIGRTAARVKNLQWKNLAKLPFAESFVIATTAFLFLSGISFAKNFSAAAGNIPAAIQMTADYLQDVYDDIENKTVSGLRLHAGIAERQYDYLGFYISEFYFEIKNASDRGKIVFRNNASRIYENIVTAEETVIAKEIGFSFFFAFGETVSETGDNLTASLASPFIKAAYKFSQWNNAVESQLGNGYLKALSYIIPGYTVEMLNQQPIAAFRLPETQETIIREIVKETIIQTPPTEKIIKQEIQKITETEKITEVTKVTETVKDADVADINNRISGVESMIASVRTSDNYVSTPRVFNESGNLTFTARGGGSILLSADNGLQLNGGQIILDANGAFNTLPYITVKDTLNLDNTNFQQTGSSQINTMEGNLTVNGNAIFGDSSTDTMTISSSVGSNLIPSATNAYSFGSVSNQWKSLYLSGSALYLDGTSLSNDGGTLVWTGAGGIQTGATDFSSLSVSGNTILGDSSIDTLTLNAGTITSASSTTWNIANAGTLIWKDGTNILMTLTDSGTTGNLALTGNVSGVDLALSGNATIGDATGDEIALNSRFVSSLIPKLDANIDLGTSDLRFNNLYALTMNVSGTNNSGQAAFTYNPPNSSITSSSVFINPTTIDADDPLLGVAIAGSERFRVDAEGDVSFVGSATLGDASTDTLTLNAGTITSASPTTWALASNTSALNIDNGTLTIDSSGNIVTAATLNLTNQLAIAYGGTAATNSTDARSNLGLAIGTDVQAYDAELAAIAGLTSAADLLPYFTGSGTATTASLTSFTRSLIDDANSATARTTLGLAIGTDVQSYSSLLADIAALSTADSNFIVGNGSTWAAETGAAARTSLGLGSVENTALTTWAG